MTSIDSPSGSAMAHAVDAFAEAAVVVTESSGHLDETCDDREATDGQKEHISTDEDPELAS